jgi:hypothetical protein
MPPDTKARTFPSEPSGRPPGALQHLRVEESPPPPYLYIKLHLRPLEVYLPAGGDERRAYLSGGVWKREVVDAPSMDPYCEPSAPHHIAHSLAAASATSSKLLNLTR